MILQIQPIKQKRNCCGPACMEMLLKFYGIEGKDQVSIGKDLHISASRGCYPFQIVRYLKKQGVECRKEEGLKSLKYLNITRPIIVDTTNHFMLLIGQEDSTYYLIDPLKGKIVKKTIEFFKKEIKGYIIVYGVQYVQEN